MAGGEGGRDMNTRQLPYFIAIAETKSLSAASRRLGISQPALSRHVSNVEREMGEKLFERRNGELHLTDAGTIYINGARAILAAERQAMEEIAGLDEHGGHVQGQ